MATKPQSENTTANPEPVNTMAALQQAGLGNMMGMSTAWLQAINGLNAEVTSFLSERIKQDVKTQQKILNCKDLGELSDIQREFIQTAIDQYTAETGKLLELGTSVFSGALKGGAQA